MKCPKCAGTGEIQVCVMGFIGRDECDKCHGKGYLNNEEWIKSASTEQLADVIFRICERATWDYNVKIMVGEKKKELIVEWLKQPHNS